MHPEVLSRSRAALVAGGVTGDHQSHSRLGTVRKIEALLSGDPEESFGLTIPEGLSVAEVLASIATLTGCSSEIPEDDCNDRIDPELTMLGIVQAAERLAAEARRGATLLAVTGHPTGLLEHHIRVVDAFRAAGGKPVRLREEETLVTARRGRSLEVRYIGGVGCLADWGSLRHTHSAEAMEAVLDTEPWPDIVLGDHGFAGAAIERGIPTIAVMDVNDPALAVAASIGKDVTIIPMDDNRAPRHYEGSWRIFQSVLARAGS